VTDYDQIADVMPEKEMNPLTTSIYEYVENNEIVTRYKINKYYANQNNEVLSDAINLLLQAGAIEYCPTGIKIGPNPLILQSFIPCDESPQIPIIPTYLESIQSIDERIDKYVHSSNLYVPIDEIGHIIYAMRDSIEKDVLNRCFLESDEVSESILSDKRLNNIIKGFCNSFQCDRADVDIFTHYFIPSNLFVYVFNRSISYYRMMCLKYKPGNMSPELLLNYADGEDTTISIIPGEKISLFDRFSQFTQGYMEMYNNEKYSSFVECYLFLLNDYSVGIESLDYLAYKMHGLNPNEFSSASKDFASIFDCFITTSHSVKYLSSENISTVLTNLKNIYGGHAITPEKMFKDNQDMLLQYYIEDLSEFKQIIKKYASFNKEEGYVCFDTTLETAISDFARELKLFDWSKMSRSFIRKYGGDLYSIAGFAKRVELNSEDACNKQMTEGQYVSLVESFKNYSWTSSENAKDVFEYKCNCGELFSNYNMHKLGFDIDGDAYYRTTYGNLRECLKSTVFTGEDFFVYKGFEVDLNCTSLKKEVDYLITNLMWIPVSESRYINLRTDKYDPLFRAIKRCKPLLEEMCREDFMTAYKLKKNGTGIEYIDDDDFEIIFYDALLMSTRANRNTIMRQRAYHYGNGTAFGNASFIKHIVSSEGGESNVTTILSILESEYGIRANEPYVRQLINQSDCTFFKETDMVYENDKAYMEGKKNEKFDKSA